MSDRWNDSALFIEDCNNNGAVPDVFHDRRNKSRWAGSLPAPTMVYGLHATLGTPHPPFKGFGELVDYPGDRVTTPASSTGYSTPSSTTRSTSRDPPPHLGRTGSSWESPMYQEDLLRHRAFSTMDRDRYRDDSRSSSRDYNAPVSDRRSDSGSRHDRRDNGYTTERARFHNYSLVMDDRDRARDMAITRNRGPVRQRSRSPGPRDRRPTPVPRTIPNPDIRMMRRGADAHPQSRWAIAQTGSPPPLGDVVCPPPDTGYVARETARIAMTAGKPLHARKDGQAPMRHERTAAALGPWLHLQVATIAQAYNVAALLGEGSQETYALFKNIINNCAVFPIDFRSEGEAYLITNQQELDRSYWIASTGARRGAHEVDGRGSTSNRSNDTHRPPSVHSVFDATLAHHPQNTDGYSSYPPPSDRGYSSGFGAPLVGRSLTHFGDISFATPTTDYGQYNHFPQREIANRPQPVNKPRVESAADRPVPPPQRTVTPHGVLDDAPAYVGTSPPNVDDVRPTLDAMGSPPSDG
ncbi:hypothetical protein B0H12DRAFT_1238819 [Mycena haematopus]|nr:hypothetical protein B0H12DRAFT_1238819 [Mycena haematopus]